MRLLKVPTDGVPGNCDALLDLEDYRLVQLEEITILLIHGHQYGPEKREASLAQLAQAKGAQLVVYGHTHVALSQSIGGIWVFNPGSVYRPRKGGASMGIITIDGPRFQTEILPLALS